MLKTNLKTASDPQLIRACLEGDATAWDTLIGRYQAFIFSILIRMGLSQADAEDLFQEVCLLLYHHLQDLRDTERLAGWLASTTRREVWRLHRRRQNQPTHLSDQEWLLEREASTEQETTSTPEDDLLRLEDQHLVHRGLEQLSERCRRLLTLLYVDDPPSSYAEASEHLRLPVGSIGPTRARCLQSLEKILLELGF